VLPEGYKWYMVTLLKDGTKTKYRATGTDAISLNRRIFAKNNKEVLDSQYHRINKRVKNNSLKYRNDGYEHRL
jgi:hypothetical protein